MEVTCVEKNQILFADGIHYQVKLQMLSANASAKTNEGANQIDLFITTKDETAFEVGQIYDFDVTKH
jgi:hypothetical protein